MLCSRCNSNNFAPLLLSIPAQACYQERSEVKQLYQAGVQKTREILQRMKEEGTLFEINSRYYKMHSPLEKAAMLGDIEKVQCLVEEGGAKDCLLEEGNAYSKWSALAAAACATQEVVVDYLLSRGARSDLFFQKDRKTVSFIFEVVHAFCVSSEKMQDKEMNQRQIRCLERILKANQNLAVTQESLVLESEWPFQKALIHGRRDLMEILAKFGFDWPDLNRARGRDCEFFDAVLMGHLKVVQWFIETYPIPIDLFEEKQGSIFEAAAAKGYSKMVRYLKDCSEKPVILTISEKSFRFYSSLEVSKKAVICLAKYLSSLKDFEGFDTMELCCAFLREQIIDEPVDEAGHTLLHLAAQWPKNAEVQNMIIPELLQKGANRSAKDQNKQTPFDIAAIEINRLYPPHTKMEKEVLRLYRAAKILLPPKKAKRISRSAPL